MSISKAILFLFLFGLILGCNSTEQTSKESELAFSAPPEWSKNAIWYQIFVERFRNGDLNNDPTIDNIKGAVSEAIPSSWSVTPWNHAWFKQEQWATDAGYKFHTSVQMRRYGGDLQGVIDKIDYLKDLGINAVYFNPLNDAPSLHKYDARNYHHIDVNFGPSPERDVTTISKETPNNPDTWKWTAADSLFLVCIDQLHKNGIRVILDYSWNHTGTQFWAFKDIIDHRTSSKYKDWYEINQLGKEGEPMDYEGWLNIKSLPELKKIRSSPKRPGHSYEGNIVDPVKQHIFDISQRWIDPNQDGFFDDGIDGMRLDVAEHVPLGFWREFRSHVRNINPDFYLVGENWWTSWPDTLMDPKPWIQGDIFDAVMHYHWYKPSRSYFGQTDDRLTLKQYTGQLDLLFAQYKPATAQAMMNLTASHDSPRFWSSIGNTNKYKYHARSGEDSLYNEGPPSDERVLMGKILLLHQFTFVGSPHVWNGDEMGMWGSDDPDCRKPLWWDDMTFDEESGPDKAALKYNIVPKRNEIIFEIYQDLINLRNQNKAFRSPEYKWLSKYIDQGLFAYERGDFEVIINATSEIIKTDEIKGQLIYQINEDPDFNENSFFPPFSGKVFRK